eukprot:scaffold62423_cov30-Tisochrysis_lutea.AAC.1
MRWPPRSSSPPPLVAAPPSPRAPPSAHCIHPAPLLNRLGCSRNSARLAASSPRGLHPSPQRPSPPAALLQPHTKLVQGKRGPAPQCAPHATLRRPPQQPAQRQRSWPRSCCRSTGFRRRWWLRRTVSRRLPPPRRRQERCRCTGFRRRWWLRRTVSRRLPPPRRRCAILRAAPPFARRRNAASDREGLQFLPIPRVEVAALLSIPDDGASNRAVCQCRMVPLSLPLPAREHAPRLMIWMWNPRHPVSQRLRCLRGSGSSLGWCLGRSLARRPSLSARSCRHGQRAQWLP